MQDKQARAKDNWLDVIVSRCLSNFVHIPQFSILLSHYQQRRAVLTSERTTSLFKRLSNLSRETDREKSGQPKFWKHARSPPGHPAPERCGIRDQPQPDPSYSSRRSATNPFGLLRQTGARSTRAVQPRGRSHEPPPHIRDSPGARASARPT